MEPVAWISAMPAKHGGYMKTRSDEVLATLADLVSINSINPAYENGVPEEDVAKYFESFFRTARG